MHGRKRVWPWTASHRCMSLSLSRRRFTGHCWGRVIDPPTDHLRRGEGPSQHFWMMPKPKKPKQPLSSTPTIIFCQSRHRRRRREIEHSSHSKVGWMPRKRVLHAPTCFWQLSVLHLASMRKDMGFRSCVRSSSRKFEDSRVIAAAYDTHVSILAALQRTLGRSVIRNE